MEKRGQLGFEYLVIVGVVMVLILPLLSYLFSSADQQLNVENAVSAVYEIGLTAEELSYLGPGSSKSVVVGEGIESIETSPGVVKGNLVNGQVVFVPSTNSLGTATIDGAQIGIANNNGLIETFSVPEIEYISPNGGPLGTIVTVHGNNFKDSSWVSFGEAQLPTTFIDIHTLAFTVPAGARSGRIRVVVVTRSVASNYRTFVVS